jgi:hypothetical protein
VFETLTYSHIVAMDFEFTAPPGERPIPLCAVFRELRTGQTIRQWLQGVSSPRAPFSTGLMTLFLAYYLSAELGCFLALGWPFPVRTLDLYAEFRCQTSGLSVPCGNGLLGALAYHGLDGLAATEKTDMRELAMRGGEYTAEERANLLAYCETDVDALARLFPVMLPKIDLPRALLRGRYMAAAARMEANGVPIDTDALATLRDGWERIKNRLIATVDSQYGVFVPTGQRTLNPESTFGRAILQTAADWEIDPYRLAEAVDYVHAEEKQINAQGINARRAARRATGLTARRIDQWEDLGRDSASYPGLDETARTLAHEFPDLGLGQGYTTDGGTDETDYAGQLWQLLRESDERVKPKHDPDILQRAAEMVVAHCADGLVYWGPMTFSAERFAAYLTRKGIPWPRLESGALALDDDTFREMARAYPMEIGPLRELRYSLSQLRLRELTVGSDGRNRCLLSAFGSRTGRNQPSNSKFIFGPATWFRSLIRPRPGMAIAYIDWSQQELGIAAALSGDERMQTAYRSGDFYLTFAQMAGAVPPDATKKTHAAEREQFKVVSLGVQYGLSADGIARRLNVQPCLGRQLLRMHQETFRTFWQWSDAVEAQGILTGQLQTVFGWTVHVGPGANPRSLRNFPMQGNGAEMLRLACCLATERGIRVCAPVHDALLVEGAADEIETVVADTQEVMQQASELVLPGFSLRTEAKIVRYPDRYTDPRGKRMWDTVWGLLQAETGSATPITGDTPVHR